MKKLTCSKVDLGLQPVEVARKLSHLEGMMFFDSSGNLPVGFKNPVSIIAAEPVQVIRGVGCDFTEVRAAMEKYDLHSTEVQFPSFPVGGAFGWVDYDGDFCFGVYESCLFFDHDASQWYEVGKLSKKLLDSKLLDFEIGHFTAHTSREDYISGVQKVQEYIRAGDIYQVNLTQKFSTKVKSGSLFSLYDSLRRSTPAPMSLYLSLEGREVLSSSPETFLKMDGRRIETRPIKGTRPRYKNKEQDEESAKELLESAKERSELVMITDLERNDLGQVCEYGSVKVDEMLQLEKLEHVYHLVSKVSGQLREDVDYWLALEKCFPGGSITGAPKKRAMEIIDELESEDRGLYTGAVGYVGFNQVSQFNIVIRTLVREEDDLHYHVGAGIVADSDAETEYEETLHKAKGIRRALKLSK